jgi:hypothetical protein
MNVVLRSIEGYKELDSHLYANEMWILLTNSDMSYMEIWETVLVFDINIHSMLHRPKIIFIRDQSLITWQICLKQAPIPRKWQWLNTLKIPMEDLF